MLLEICDTCDKDDDIIPLPCVVDCDTSKLEVLWQEPLHIDSGAYGSFDPIVYQNNVLFSLIYYSDTEILKMRDGKTGGIQWEWEPPFGKGYSSFSNAVFLKENKLIYCGENEVYSINMDDGKTNWAYDNQAGMCGWPRIKVWGDFVYHIHQPCGAADNIAYLVRTEIDDGTEWDTIFTQLIKNGYSPGLELPDFWLNPQGDTILFFINRMVNFSISSDTSNKVDLLAFNLTQRKLEYEIEEFDATGKANFHPPLVWNNRIYVQGHHTIYCFDAASGQKLWASEYKGAGEHTSTGNLLIVNDKLVSYSNVGNFYVFDPWSGVEIRKVSDAGSNGPDMVAHEGIVYYGNIGDGRLHAIDVETGKHIWRERSPNRKNGFPGANFLHGVAINPELGCLYTSDNHFAMCIKLPEK